MPPLIASPGSVQFADLKRGNAYHAMRLQLHSSNAADAVEVRMHCDDPNLVVEVVTDKPGTVQLVLFCSQPGTVKGSLVCTSPSGSITVPVSARILEPTVYQAMRLSTPLRGQPQPSGLVEELTNRRRVAPVDVGRRPPVHVRALKLNEPAGARRRPAATVPLVWTEKDPALQDAPSAPLSKHEHTAIAVAQITEGAANQQRESKDVAGAQRSLLRLVSQIHSTRNAVEMVVQAAALPEATLQPCRALQLEFEALDPMIADAEGFMAKQSSEGQRRAAAIQKATLAPALIEQAGKSERWAHSTLASEQEARRGVEARLRAADAAAAAHEAAAARAESSLKQTSAQLEATRAECARLTLAEAEARSRLPPLQRECEGMRAAIRKNLEKEQSNVAEFRDFAAVERQLGEAKKEAAALLRSHVPREEAEQAKAKAKWAEQQLEKLAAQLEGSRSQHAELVTAARLDAEWRLGAKTALERLLRWSKRPDVAARLPDAEGQFKTGSIGDPFDRSRVAEDWLGTLSTLVGDVSRQLEMVEVLPRGDHHRGGGGAGGGAGMGKGGGGQLAGKVAHLETLKKTHRSKLLAARTRLATAVSQQALLRVLGGTMRAWRLFVRRAAAERLATQRADAEGAVAQARAQADNVASESRGALQQAVDAARREVGLREKAERAAEALQAQLAEATAQRETLDVALAAAKQREEDAANGTGGKATWQSGAMGGLAGEVADLRGELKFAHEAQDLAEARAKRLHAQLRERERRMHELERLTQTYAREAGKRMGYDQVALAAERERRAEQENGPPVAQPPLVPTAPPPPFAPSHPRKQPMVTAMPNFRYRLAPTLHAGGGARPDGRSASRPQSASLTRPMRPTSAGTTRPASARGTRTHVNIGGTLLAAG